jgi:molybdate transport system ATP-binding protein
MSLPESAPVRKPESPHLSFEMKHRLGALSLDVAFSLIRPWSILFAPSGAGKTTILRAIAGLLKPRHARIVSTARVSLQNGGTMSAEFVLTDTVDSIFVPPHRRAICMVAQNAALFPHLTVLKNIRYRFFDQASTLEERKQQEDDLRALLALCRVEHLIAKMPAQLSGGERQRVALARSLAVPACNLLLLDEPFTGLDAALRDELITDLRVWLARRNIPVLSVTHDVSEAFQLNAEVLKLHSGRITAQGPAAIVLAEERTRLLAQLNVASVPTESPSS